MRRRLFHQNMWNYGGADAQRNALFDHCFATIQARTGANYLVAGFTEIRNPRSGANFAYRASALDPALWGATLMAVGRTALSPKPEYTGIAWNMADLDVRHYGQVLYNSTHSKWVCYNNYLNLGGIPPFTVTMPAHGELGADSRGLAYIAGDYKNRHLVVAFMHNTYSVGSPSAAFGQLWHMRNCIITTIKGTNQADSTRTWEVYVGGDFNVSPSTPGASRATLHCAAETYYNANQDQFYYFDTTASHTYDFWLCDPDRGDQNARVAHETRRSGASDHAGIILKI